MTYSSEMRKKLNELGIIDDMNDGREPTHIKKFFLFDHVYISVERINGVWFYDMEMTQHKDQDLMYQGDNPDEAIQEVLERAQEIVNEMQEKLNLFLKKKS